MAEETAYYSKAEAQEFKELLEQKLAAARAELKEMQQSLKTNEDGAADSLNVTEFSSDVADRVNTERLMGRQIKFIDNLERALVRIHNGTYGRCKVTGKRISKERLRAVPHTETSIEGKLSAS